MSKSTATVTPVAPNANANAKVNGLLHGKVAIVTGVSSGIGAATAKVFAAEGAKVVLGARRLERLNTIVAEIKAAGGEAIGVQIDVTKEEDAKKLVDAAVKQYGGLHIAFNNAGILRGEKLESITAAHIKDVIDTNINGVLYGIKHQIPALLASGLDGVIINNSSITSLRPGTSKKFGVSMYGASKLFINYITQSAAAELAGKIRVNAILPGPIATEMSAGAPQEVLDEVIKNDLLVPRLGKDIEVADLTAFLASDKAKFITGALYTVDGGGAIA